MAADLQRIRQRIKDKHPNNKIARYREYLLELSREFPAIWEHLSVVSLSKDRKIVARISEDLFVSSPHLIDQYAYRIAPGWWLDINLDVPGMKLRLEIAQRIYLENVVLDDDASEGNQDRERAG